jgi:hypothetical protein
VNHEERPGLRLDGHGANESRDRRGVDPYDAVLLAADEELIRSASAAGTSSRATTRPVRLDPFQSPIGMG